MCVCRRLKSTSSAGSDDEEVDELSLIDHKEIMSRITLKQEVGLRVLRTSIDSVGCGATDVPHCIHCCPLQSAF